MQTRTDSPDHSSGWFDPLIQNKAYVDFATNAPGYGPLQNATVLRNVTQAYYGPNGCESREQACYASAASPGTASNQICRAADDFCVRSFISIYCEVLIFFQSVKIFVPAVGDRDANDLRQNSSTPNPRLPEYYVNFLNLDSTKKAIGALPSFIPCNYPSLFAETGDVRCHLGGWYNFCKLIVAYTQDARTWLPHLGALANSRLKMLVWVEILFSPFELLID